MEYPLVSVIIPVYNMEAFLAEAIDSVLASTYPNFEIVIIDDGSTDQSPVIAETYSAKDQRIRFYRQPNRGVSAARNLGLEEARGEFVLPVDADNKISPDFIEKAVSILINQPHIKVVYTDMMLFGEKNGLKKYRKYKKTLLARKNIIDACAMYRRIDALKIGGYCEEIIGREDWEFWISLLKNGGEVVHLPEIGFYYRIRSNSKRISDRKLKKHIIEVLNRRHKAFFYRELGGKLHYQRSLSRLFNFFIHLYKPETFFVSPNFKEEEEFFYSLPDIFDKQGETIHSGRNTIKIFDVGNEKWVVKSFQLPNVVNRFVYGIFRKSKARRSYEYALKLLSHGISTPHPIGYYEQKIFFLFDKSFYVSVMSECNHRFEELIRDANFPDREKILKAVARFTAELHEKGVLHSDYSAGNILFSHTNDDINIELIDLNRLKFGKISKVAGCRNFERLNLEPGALKIMAEEYAVARGFDKQECVELVLQYRWKKHKTINS
ncbi:MAG: glycosyltransferase [Paludibacteraceae bacterium]|nr:glycosyltransferase [Paludibacteraceae bacterium]